MTEYYKILRIHDSINSVSPGQIAVESSIHSLIGVRAWGGKDWYGNVTRFLALDRPGRLTTLNLSGNTTSGESGYLMHDASGNITGKHTPTDTQYTEGDGIDITSQVVSNTGVLSVTGSGTARSGDLVFTGSGVSSVDNVFTFVNTNTVTTANVDKGAVFGDLIFSGSGVSQGGTGNKTFTFTNTTYTSGSFDHGGLGGLNDDDHNGTNGYIRTDGARVFTGNQSMGGHDIIGAVNIRALNNDYDIHEEMYNDIGLGIAEEDYFYSAISSHNGTLIIDSWVSADTRGGAEIVGTDGEFYSSARETLDNLIFSDPNFQASLLWTSNQMILSETVDDVDAIYNLGATPGEKSFMGAIAAAAYLPQYAIAYGDADGLQHGDISNLRYNAAGEFILNNGFKISMVQSTNFLTGYGGFWFDDTWRTGSTWVSGLGVQLFRNTANWTALRTLIGGEGSFVDGILAAASSGGGNLQAAYDFGGDGLGAVVALNGQAIKFGKSAESNSSVILRIENNKALDSSPLVVIDNDCAWTDTVKPSSFLFQGASGNTYEVEGEPVPFSLGHRLWTTDHISVGRTNDVSFNAYFSATEGPYTNPDGNRVVAQIVADSFDTFGGGHNAESYVRVTGGRSGPAGTTLAYSSAEINGWGSASVSSTYGSVSLNPATSVTLNSKPFSNCLSVNYGTHTVVTPGATLNMNLATGKQLQECVITAATNVTQVSLTPPTLGGAWFNLTVFNSSGAARTLTNFTNAGTGNPVTWMNLDLDATPISIPNGEMLNVHLLFNSRTSSYLGWAWVSA